MLSMPAAPGPPPGGFGYNSCGHARLAPAARVEEEGQTVPQLPFARRILGCAAALLALAGGFAPAAAAYTPAVLRVGFVPSENLRNILAHSQPIIDQLAKSLKMRVVPFVATDYTGIIEAMRAGKLDVAFFAPAAYVLAERKAGAKVILKAERKGKSVFYSAVITHRGSGIRSLQDLKGKTFAFVDPASASGGVYPKLLLLNAGLNPERDFSRVIYAGGHDAAVLAVLNRKVDAAATFANDTEGKDAAWTQYLTKPSESSQIVAVAYSKPIPNDNVAVSGKLEPALVGKIKTAFMHLNDTPAGRKLLWDMYRSENFVEATPAEFDTVREAFDKVGFKVQ